MKRQFAFPIVIAMLFASQTVANASPPIFSRLSLSEAKARAQKQNRLLLVDFTASWCGPCNHMDETTWVDKNVDSWISKNAIAIQIDVDEDEATSAALSIHAMPTVVVFEPKGAKEFDRHTGYLDSPKFLKWVEGLQKGESTLATLTRIVSENSGKGGEAEVDARYELAKYLLNAGKDVEATKQFIWLWQNIEKEAPSMAGVRVSFMASEMESLAKHSKYARDCFYKLRDSESNSLANWIRLNDVLGENKKTLAWFDQNKGDPVFVRNIASDARFELKRLFKSAKRQKDLGTIIVDPLAEIKRQYQVAQEIKKYADEFDSFPVEAGTIYGALLAAGRDKEADLVANESIRLDNTAAMRYRILTNWLAQSEFQSLPQKSPGYFFGSLAIILLLVAGSASFILKKRGQFKLSRKPSEH